MAACNSVANHSRVGKSTTGAMVVEVGEAIIAVVYKQIANVPESIAGFERMGL